MWFLILNVLLVFKSICGTNGTNFYKYNVTQGSSNDQTVRCIARSLNAQHEALRIRDWDGECTILTLNWMSNKTYHVGYTYVEKPTTVIFESFSLDKPFGVPNPEDPEKERVWTLPIPLKKGGSIQIYITISSLELWGRFQFRLSNISIGSPFRLENDVPVGIVLFSIFISKLNDEVRFKTYDGARWRSQPTITQIPFVEERAYLIAVLAADAGFQILFDGVEQAVLPYIGLPEEGKSLLFIHNRNVILPRINNVTLT